MHKLATYIANAQRRALPAAVTERAKHHLLDTLAAMLSGAQLLPGRRAIEFVSTQGGVPEATVIGSNIVTSAINAALANGMHAHADETDDTYYLALVHPGCGVVPAALALAERERASGTALLRAMVLGYDVCARMSIALGIERFRERGHSTHSFGHMFGAAAASAAIMKLNVDQTRYLLSYTAQQASGLSCWARDIEHIEKAFDFGGMPARNGVTAALMTSMRFTGVEDVFDGDRSFFHAHGLTADPKKLIHGLGKTYEIMNTSIKRWAVGYPIQAPLDAVLNLIAKYRLTAADVERVTITIDDQGARTVSLLTTVKPVALSLATCMACVATISEGTVPVSVTVLSSLLVSTSIAIPDTSVSASSAAFTSMVLAPPLMALPASALASAVFSAALM
jgi:2-methylcitrate dehydratase PrpD